MTILYFVLAALCLGILVFIHELGHYFVAKKMGMKVESFGIGFGRPLLKWRWNEVDWQLGWLPFGGFVKIAGMEFGKKEKQLYHEPYEIPNGFFSKSPLRRVSVAVAGPFANFFLALLAFLLIWSVGGREKPFADYTKIVGWVDPKSELYAQGLRPGDMIASYNGKPFKGAKDLLYAAMLDGKDVTFKGYHIDYKTGDKTPFSYTISTYPASSSIDGIMTTGINANARYLLYDRFPDGEPNVLQKNSPMENSGIQYGDRLIWAEGEILYSLDQLSYLLNNDHALLTIERNNHYFLTRQPRVEANDLIIPSHIQHELTDWQYEVDLKGQWQNLRVLPYIVNNEGYIEAPLKFIDQESRLKAFPLHPFSSSLEGPLTPSDRIVAVDGVAVEKGYDILKLLQSHQVQLMVERNVSLQSKESWRVEDKTFEKMIPYLEIQKLASYVGRNRGETKVHNLVLLNPVKPKHLDQIYPEEQFQAEFERQKKKIEAIRDQEKKAEALERLEKERDKLFLGIHLQDRVVDYNPNPFVMFSSVFLETWQTLKALIFGYLHPKWVSGPIGIVQVIHHGWQLGITEALYWIGAISVNLGFLNLLPVPVLDGGYICLSFWELITRRRVKARTMERIIIPFVVLLIGLLVFLTFQDLSRLF